MEAMPATPRERATPRVGDFGLAYLWDDPDATANAHRPERPDRHAPIHGTRAGRRPAAKDSDRPPTSTAWAPSSIMS